MPASKKVCTQLLVSPHVRARAQALALIRQESVAEIYRIALEGGGLTAMEAAHAGQIADLDAALASIGGDRIDTLDFITSNKFRYADLFDGDGRPMIKLPRARLAA